MERKKIIIDEIKYWKKSRLLPEQYCNFLLSLYTEGQETGRNDEIKEKSTQVSFLPIVIMIFGLSLFGLTFLVIYFTDFSPLLQTGLVFILSGVMFFLATQIKRFDHRLIHLYILLGALMIFLATIHAVSFIFPNQPGAIMGAVIITCFGWLFIGKKYNLKYFMISGAIGIVISIYFLF